MERLVVVPFRQGPFWNISYLLACAETREAAVIDPAWDIQRVLDGAGARGLTIRSVFVTHSHSDHANGIADLVQATGAAVFACTNEEQELRAHFAGPIERPGHEGRLCLGKLAVEALHTPGHSPGSLSFLVDGRLFSGDTLSVGSVGRAGPGRESVEALWQSVGRLRMLPPETVLHPGHDEGPAMWSTLGEELERAEGLRARSLEEFVAALERSTGRSHGHEG